MAFSNKTLSKGSVIAALDIGSTKTACFIARVVSDDGAIEVIGVGHQASEGIKAGAVTELDKVETSVRKAVHAAEQIAASVLKGYPLREVVLNMPVVQTSTFFSKIDVDVQGETVTDKDINRAILKGQQQNLPRGHSWLHTIPVGYTLDGQSNITKPNGLFGRHLSVDLNSVSCDNLNLQNFTTSLERCHLDVTAFCATPYASGLACLVKDEMDLGCTVIDMGGGTTQIAVFYNGQLLYTSAVPVGGMHVTSDIARGLNTSLEDAERIKTLYGSVISSSSDDNEVIDVPLIGEGEHGVSHVERSTLTGIIRPRLEETFEMVRARLDDSGISKILGRNVILTGGASQLPGVRELAKAVLDKKIRFGKPIALAGLPDATHGPAFSTASGLLVYMRDRFEEQPSFVANQNVNNTFFEKVKFWLQENW